MQPLSQAQLLQIARSITGYKRYTAIDLSDGNPPAEFAWIPSEYIYLNGDGYAFYYETVAQARALRQALRQGLYSNCTATSNGLPITFVCLSDEIESQYL